MCAETGDRFPIEMPGCVVTLGPFFNILDSSQDRTKSTRNGSLQLMRAAQTYQNIFS